MNQTSVPGSPTTAHNPIRVLVVDDSAFIRVSISRYLNDYPGIRVVGGARDGLEALEMIPRLQPDVITLDVEMPRLDGLSTLREIMSRFPRPVIMLSSLTKEGTAETVQALTLGAVDFTPKPTDRMNIQSVMAEVISKIERAAGAKVKPIAIPAAEYRQVLPLPTTKPFHTRQRHEPVVLIGTSTGGPKALNEVIPALPADLPAAVVVVQHMPAGFTHSLAERLNNSSALLVKEAEPGDRLAVGRVLLAPGGFHMVFDENEQVVLNQNPPMHGVRPAVDVTLTSLIQRCGRLTSAVILTGMGSDGTTGAVLLHSLGGQVIAEDESSCVVYGMPRSVVEANAASQVVPLAEIPAAILQALQSFSSNTGK